MAGIINVVRTKIVHTVEILSIFPSGNVRRYAALTIYPVGFTCFIVWYLQIAAHMDITNFSPESDPFTRRNLNDHSLAVQIIFCLIGFSATALMIFAHGIT